jgi:hypothetical protein
MSPRSGNGVQNKRLWGWNTLGFACNYLAPEVERSDDDYKDKIVMDKNRKLHSCGWWLGTPMWSVTICFSALSLDVFLSILTV